VSKGKLEREVEHFERAVLPNLPQTDVDVTGWLKSNGFFTAPASTKYHGNWEGGLYEHCLQVMNQLVALTGTNNLAWERRESPYLVGIFHDLCKIDQYEDNPKGMMIGEPPYVYNSASLLKGHGDKSVMLLSSLYRLTEEEVACIRYHMGAFTDKEEWNHYTNAIHVYPNVLWTHHADMIASHVLGV